jgi:MFS family permease
VLTWSILIYAVSAFAAGYSTNIWQFLFFRCTTFVGVCVEFVAARRLACGSVHRTQTARARARLHAGVLLDRGALVTAANAWVLTHGTSLPAIYGGHEAWRYTLMSGVVPALPLIIIRPFLPESPGVDAEEGGRHIKAAEPR